MRRLALVLAFVAVTAGCARANTAKGGGERVAFCAGYEAYDGLLEPATADRRAVLTYADGVVRVMDRVDTDLKAKSKPVPASIAADLKTVRHSLAVFRAAYGSASTDAGRAAAVAALTADTARAGADQRIAAFYQAACKAPTFNS